MNKSIRIAAMAALAVFTVFTAAAQQVPPQLIDWPKLFQEIAGDYDYDMQGQGMTVNFFVNNGKLWGAPPGETPEEIVPVKGDNPLKFEVTVAANGQYFEIEFGRDDKGAVDKCTLKSQGMEVIGKKRAK
jgi:hypothetical protein